MTQWRWRSPRRRELRCNAHSPSRVFVPCTQPSNVLSLESEGASSGNAAVSLSQVRLNVANDGGGESEVDAAPAEDSELVAGDGRPLRSDPQLQLAYLPVWSISYPRVAKIVKVSPLGIGLALVQSGTGVAPPSLDVLSFR